MVGARAGGWGVPPPLHSCHWAVGLATLPARPRRASAPARALALLLAQTRWCRTRPWAAGVVTAENRVTQGCVAVPFLTLAASLCCHARRLCHPRVAIAVAGICGVSYTNTVCCRWLVMASRGDTSLKVNHAAN